MEKKKASKKDAISKTEESIFTLLSLYVLTNQAFESLFGKEEILHSSLDVDKISFSSMVNDTIHEALVYQILLKACAYMDEWNNVFGVRTDEADKERVALVKKVASPACRCVSNWKHLRDFRNQAIAHNHRDKGGNNIYLSPRLYDSPQSNGEIYLLVYCLEKMTDVVNFYFPNSAKKVLKIIPDQPKLSRHKFMTKKDIKQKIAEVDKRIYDVIMAQSVIDALAKSTRKTSKHS